MQKQQETDLKIEINKRTHPGPSLARSVRRGARCDCTHQPDRFIWIHQLEFNSD